MSQQSLSIALARALTGGDQEHSAVSERIAETLGTSRVRWIERLAIRYLKHFEGQVRPREREVVHFVLRDRAWNRRLRSTPERKPRYRVARWPLDSLNMHPVDAATSWAVQSLDSVAAIAEWLNVSIPELEWFADLNRIAGKQLGARVHHYHYKVLHKRSGGIRVIEAPKGRLKTIQQKILTGILEKIPAYRGAAHGFVKGRSVRTFAEPHVGKHVVLRLDLKNFFPTISRARVQALFRTIGYSESVSDILGALCTNLTPYRVFRAAPKSASDVALLVEARTLYCRPHLPQGAPSSPLIANLCAYHLDCRLTGLADWAGAAYTRYADDLVVSGNADFNRNIDHVAATVAAIAAEQGWSVEHHKTRIMRKSVRQEIAGVIVNEGLGVRRTDFDALKATLFNCVRHGPAHENREHHRDFRGFLRGRISWIASLNAKRGAQLRALFNSINWNQ